MSTRSRHTGQVISALGVMCLLAVALIGLSGPATAAGRVARVLLYAGFMMIPIGAVLYLLAKTRR